MQAWRGNHPCKLTLFNALKVSTYLMMTTTVKEAWVRLAAKSLRSRITLVLQIFQSSETKISNRKMTNLVRAMPVHPTTKKRKTWLHNKSMLNTMMTMRTKTSVTKMSMKILVSQLSLKTSLMKTTFRRLMLIAAQSTAV